MVRRMGKAARRGGYATLALAIVLTASAQAQEGFPISTERPYFSDGTLCVPMGRLQVESGFTFAKVKGAETKSFGEILFRIPLSQRLELRIFNLTYGKANVAAGGGSGLLDPIAGIKYRFLDGVTGRRPDLAVVVQSSLPWGSNDFRVDRAQPTVKLAAYQQTDASSGVGGNLVYTKAGARGGEFDQWAVSGYWSKTLDPRTGVFLEAYHIAQVSKNGPSATYGVAGVTYLLNKATQVDFRIGTGLNQSRDGWFVGTGIAWRF